MNKEKWIIRTKRSIKEWFRKLLVTLKRNPNYIALVVLIITCLIYNLELTSYSDTTALLGESGMGLCSFVITLCSFLSIITFITAFPKRKKPKIGSIILVLILLLISIVCQGIFYYFIIYATKLKENPIQINSNRLFVNTASNICIVHIIFLIISIISIALLPVYGKLLKKINTSIKLEENDIESIQLDNDEINNRS